jgi:hypothetical protein
MMVPRRHMRLPMPGMGIRIRRDAHKDAESDPMKWIAGGDGFLRPVMEGASAGNLHKKRQSGGGELP